MAEGKLRNILVLGASGLIGRSVTDDLRARGLAVTGIARKFSASQRISAQDMEMPLLSLGESELARLITERNIDVVVNCLGVLQDGPCTATSSLGCSLRSSTAVARCGWSISRFPVLRAMTARHSV
jgi:putative NADH-flavin reductase